MQLADMLPIEIASMYFYTQTQFVLKQTCVDIVGAVNPNFTKLCDISDLKWQNNTSNVNNWINAYWYGPNSPSWLKFQNSS